MKREEFLNSLRENLTHLPGQEINDIIRDQEEYIRDAIQSGRSEESVIDSLGSPKSFAANLSAEAKIQAKIQSAETSPTLKGQVSGTMNAVIAILALAPLNLIFVLGPFLALVGCVIAGWAVAGALLVAAVAVLVAFVFKFIFITLGVWIHLSALFFVIGWIGASLLALILMYKITELVVHMIVAYLKWNLNFVKGRSGV